jgi:RNA polymerase sigma-70 factor (ECF subfamily)
MLRDKDDAEDVTQEIFIKIWRNINSFNILAAKAWIMKATHNLCIDYLRRRKISMLRNESIDEEYSEKISNYEDSDPQFITHINMMTDKVKVAIKTLPENLKSVFVLYEIEGMKYKDISEALDIPINSVKVYLLRARKKLQEALKYYEVNEVL